MKKIFMAAAVAAPLAFSSAALAQDQGAASGAQPAAVSQAPQTDIISAAQGLDVGPLTFAAPWVLLGLGALPLLWWLMRSVPPKPKTEYFPAIRLLFNLQSEDQEPVRMPLWQRSLRLTAAAMVITGLAQPQLNPDDPLEGEGPVRIVVDNDWASARNWPARVAEMEGLISRAERDGRPVILVPTVAPEDGGPVRGHGPVDAAEARRIALEIQPQPWPADRQAARKALDALAPEDVGPVVWLSNGLDSEGALDLARQLKDLGSLTVLKDEAQAGARLLVPPSLTGDSLALTVRRPDGQGSSRLVLIASDEAGRAISQAEVEFEDGQAEAKAVFDLPPEVRNQLTRIVIEGENSAGATVLLDERWRRRPVGLVDDNAVASAQPLLDESNFIERALEPYVDLRQGDIGELLERQLAVMIVTDAAPLDEASRRRIGEWVQEGGTLLRFAGPRLAADTDDDLVPVRLRPGEHSLSGSLAGSNRGRLAPIGPQSPLYGITLSGDVTVQKEILAQPGPDLMTQTWAQLEDGTPLVTGRKHGEGWIVLVHTTANTEWSNLPLSGFFVEMMRAVVAHSQGIAGGPDGTARPLPPLALLDGEGRFSDPSPAARPLTREAIDSGTVSPQHPPGFYGDDAGRHAHNLADAVPVLAPLPDMPAGIGEGVFGEAETPKDFNGILLMGALFLLLADLVVLMKQQGHLPRLGNDQQGPAGPRRPTPAGP